ncbi:MAG: hypothetical protein Q4D59_07520 [Erysipelotrichaceae bacterium]|jgi:predicted kinase|nr:hypothetical protein [Erysipelotrichaceae bacterium]
MRIIFIAGPAFSGKSIYIERNFPEAKTVKISTFNKIAYEAIDNEELETLAKNAWLYCKEALQNTIRTAGADDTVILEHQLLKKDDRAFYLDAVREVTDEPVELIVMDPDEDMIERMLNFEKSFIMLHVYEKGKMELPEAQEGFARIEIAHPVFNEDDFKR